MPKVRRSPSPSLVDAHFPVQDAELDGLAVMLQDEFWGNGADPEYDMDYWLARLSRSRAEVRLVRIDPVRLAEKEKLKAIVPSLVMTYASLLDKGCNQPPIVLVAGRLVDGIHRTLAAVHVGCPSIPAIWFQDAREVRAFGEKLKHGH